VYRGVCYVGREMGVICLPNEIRARIGKQYMGYEVHITRKECWFDSEGPKISMAEWRSYVADDPELDLKSTATSMPELSL